VPVKGLIPEEETVSDQKPLPIPSAPEQAVVRDSLQDVAVRASDLGKVISLPAREEDGAFHFRDLMLIIIAGLLIMVLFILRRRKGAG
jgi:hypothetical protein